MSDETAVLLDQIQALRARQSELLVQWLPPPIDVHGIDATIDQLVRLRAVTAELEAAQVLLRARPDYN